MIWEPTTGRHDKNNMKMRVICSGVGIASNFQNSKPTEQAQTLKIATHREAMPSIRHISQTRNKRINRNIAHGKREKNKSTSGILGFDPLKTLKILAKQLNGAPPLASGTETIAAEVGGSNQAIISKTNRRTTIPYF